MKNSPFLLLSICLIGCSSYSPAHRNVQTQMHAHNDYHHQHPFYDALAKGFTSIEADIFLVDGKLLVGHSVDELDNKKTLEALYLKPLAQHIKDNNCPNSSMMLLIDIKSDGPETYQVLDQLLGRYDFILTSWIHGQVTPRPVTVVISGNRPEQQVITADQIRYAGIDGRLRDVGLEIPASIMPLISDRWSSHFTWTGHGSIPSNELQKLRKILHQAHQNGQMVRFWATPDKPNRDRENVWRVLLREDTDFIGTDDLAGLADFMHKISKENRSTSLEESQM